MGQIFLVVQSLGSVFISFLKEIVTCIYLEDIESI